MLSLANLGLRLLQRSGEIVSVHTRDDLAGFDEVTLVGQYLSNAAGIFGVDINFVGLEAAVAERDAGGQL